jgi:acetyl esterase/lipase
MMLRARLLILFFTAVTASAEVPVPGEAMTIDVWPEGKMPGKGASAAEGEVPAKGDGFHRVTNVSRPTLTWFPAKTEGDTAPAPAMIVCPGGGYSYVVVDKEGSEIAAWLNAAGVSALVLKYRVPHNREGALQDVQRALSLARARAGEWKIDPKRLGVIGFSAGGNLAAKASTQFDERAYVAIDDVDQQSCRPDFAVLVYPAYLDDKAGQVSPDLNLKAKIPPTLIVHTEDDKPFVPGSKRYHAALEEAKVTHEFLLYPTGGHGYALHCTKDARVWPEAALAWLRKVGMR